LEAAFTGKKDMQTALNDAADRSNQILRRFEQTFKGKQLP
jgi:sn-glycerol 3-phosphate transport system substrate-binding protein